MTRELGVFTDESGDRGGLSKYYLLTLVFRDQSGSILGVVGVYENSLREGNLSNIPLHSEPLLNGHGDYELLDISTRKRLLIGFGATVRHLPISCKTFVYKRGEIEDPSKLSAKMKRDISGILLDNLKFFQSFGDVKVYYDNDKDIVKQALDRSAGFVLPKNAAERKRVSMTDHRLEQVADYLCTIELAAIKYTDTTRRCSRGRLFGEAAWIHPSSSRSGRARKKGRLAGGRVGYPT